MYHNITANSLEVQAVLLKGVKQMSPEAREIISEYILDKTNFQDGACLNRAGKGDLYYTMFGLSCADALQLRLPWSSFSRTLKKTALHSLDVIHLSCWVKCSLLMLLKQKWAWNSFVLLCQLWQVRKYIQKQQLAEKIIELRDPYLVFLMVNVMQDLKMDISDSLKQQYMELLEKEQSANGSHGGVVATTVAAILTKRQLTGELDTAALDWLKSQLHELGGFRASDLTAMPDTLSTGVALFTLRVCECLNEDIIQKCSVFLQNHWLDNGGFASVINDEESDCEYTFYGLLASGAIQK